MHTSHTHTDHTNTRPLGFSHHTQASQTQEHIVLSSQTSYYAQNEHTTLTYTLTHIHITHAYHMSWKQTQIHTHITYTSDTLQQFQNTWNMTGLFIQEKCGFFLLEETLHHCLRYCNESEVGWGWGGVKPSNGQPCKWPLPLTPSWQASAVPLSYRDAQPA